QSDRRQHRRDQDRHEQERQGFGGWEGQVRRRRCQVTGVRWQGTPRTPRARRSSIMRSGISRRFSLTPARRSYTLIELLLVCTILGIAGTLLIPNIVGRDIM